MRTRDEIGLTAVPLRELRPLLTQNGNGCGAVYADAAAEGQQIGAGWRSSEGGLLFRHFCGFTMLSGHQDAAFLQAAARLMCEADVRFLLFSEDADTTAFFRRQTGFSEAERLFFTHRILPEPPPLPDGFVIRQIDGTLLERIQGRIVPAFSWESPEAFLARGKGFCVTDGETPAAWAFSAAVSSRELDIGVETSPAYRRRRLASAAAAQMIRYTYSMQKQPVWACHAGNTASRRLAEALGFVQCGCCTTFCNQGG